MTNKLIDALKKLDVNNDNHWTADGLPRLDTVKMLAADQTITRDQVAAEAPGFSRANAVNFTPVVAKDTEAKEVVKSETEVKTAEVGQEVKTAESAKVEQVKAVDDGLDALRSAFVEQSKKVEGLRQAKEKLTAEFEAERQKEDDMRAELEAKNPNVDNTPNAIQGYLAAQNKLLEERAAKKQILKESGIDFKELQSGLRAPIDTVMSRKNGRGTKRPGS